jgi:hypothetical protein
VLASPRTGMTPLVPTSRPFVRFWHRMRGNAVHGGQLPRGEPIFFVHWEGPSNASTETFTQPLGFISRKS